MEFVRDGTRMIPTQNVPMTLIVLVTLPLLWPALFAALLLRGLDALRIFAAPLVLSQLERALEGIELTLDVPDLAADERGDPNERDDHPRRTSSPQRRRA